MAAVVRMCPSVCESSHFAVLLGAYGATLSVLGKEVTRAGCGDWAVGPRDVWGPDGVMGRRNEWRVQLSNLTFL